MKYLGNYQGPAFGPQPERPYAVHWPDAGVVLLTLVTDRITLAVPQALIDDTPAFDWFTSAGIGDLT